MTLPREFEADVQHRALAATEMTDGGFTGRLVPYEVEVELWPGVREVFTRGAFKAAVKDPARVKVFGLDHQSKAVIGMAVKLEDRADGLWGEFKFASTQAASELRQLLADGFVDELSIDFQQIPSARSLTHVRDSVLVRHDRGRLLGVSPVSHGAYGRNAVVTSTRSEQLDEARAQALALLHTLNA